MSRKRGAKGVGKRATQWPDPVPPEVAPPGPMMVPTITASPSPGFAGWLADSGASLLLTTGDKLVAVGLEGSRVVLAELRFDVVMGLASAPDGTVHAASRWQLHQWRDALEGTPGPWGADALLVNQVSRTTGFVGVHDVAVDGRGRVLFTTALCNAVATVGERLNLDLVARPPFVSEDVAEERCHLLGLALDEGGELAYLTAAAETDEPLGWVADVATGGVLVDVRADAVLARGLSLPCSPRIHDGRLYVANGGTGELLRIDRDTGEATPVVALPGLARGLAFVGGRAVVGCSVPSDEGPYAALPIARRPPDTPRHGLAVVDVDNGVVEHTLTLEAGSGEVHAVTVLEGSRQVGLRSHQADADSWFVVKNTSD